MILKLISRLRDYHNEKRRWKLILDDLIYDFMELEKTKKEQFCEDYLNLSSKELEQKYKLSRQSLYTLGKSFGLRRKRLGRPRSKQIMEILND